jgi:RNA polymerase sigma factor (sigma-70 family)
MSEGLNDKPVFHDAADDRKRTAFDESRRRLRSIAYRMLGSRAEAEDVVQETYLKWHAADTDALRSPAAWLTTVATRLSIDRLRHLQIERESHAAAFVPEPWLEEFAPSAEALVSRASEFSYGLLLLLERLSPEERAALILHEAFDCGYSEIGLVLSKTAPACRQIVHRAKARLRGIDTSSAPRFSRPDVPGHLLERLREVIESQDKEAFIGLMTEDAQVVMALPETTSPDVRAPIVAGACTSSAALAEHIVGMGIAADIGMGRRGTEVVAEVIGLNGHRGIAFVHESEIVAILYVEARGEWISRCYLTAMPAHLGFANRLFDPRVAISSTLSRVLARC